MLNSDNFSIVSSKQSHFPQIKINGLKKLKHEYLINTWSDKAFDTVVNRALSSLHGGSFKITLTVTLSK